MQLITWSENKLLPFASSQETVFYAEIIPTCMVAITGWLLEYPIIYTTHLSEDDPMDELDEWEERKNCLGGNQILQLIQVWLLDHMLLSFSYPCSSDINEKELTAKLKRKIDQRLDDLKMKPDWLIHCSCCEIRREQIKLDRFAL
jgi:hypothetical protein